MRNPMSALAAMFIMIHTVSYGQSGTKKESIIINRGIPVAYIVDGKDRTARVRYMEFITPSNRNISCWIDFRGSNKTEHLTFSVANARNVGDSVIAEIGNIESTLNSIVTIYKVDSGLYSFDAVNRLHNLDVHFRTGGKQRHYVISWKGGGLSIVGRAYRALVNESCSKTATDSYMTYTYCELKFHRTTVTVSTYSTLDFVLEYSDPYREEKRYDWYEDGNSVRILGFDDFGVLKIDDSNLDNRLIGRISLGGKRFKEIVFDPY